LSAGVEVFLTRLDDYWPPVAASMMMSPNTYININGGERDRYAVWGEWIARPSATWTTTAGLRYERVETDAGDVQPYNGMGADAIAAAAFNARSHARQDDNLDATLTALWRPDATSAYEFGFSRKTRSPNLYERYAWGTGGMSSSMTSFAGDANGYVGDIDLDPEVAHSLAATAEFTSGPDDRAGVRFAVYHTWVGDFIDADYIQDLPIMGAQPTNTTFVQLQFANHDATLYGFEVAGHSELWNDEDLGLGVLSASLAYTHGTNEDTGEPLYHIAPLTGRVTVEQRLGRWTNTAELAFSGEKDRVNGVRREQETAAYALLNLRTAVEFEHVRLDLAIENVFDADYDLPLGGVSYGDYRYAGGGARPLHPLPGPGRSFNIGLSVPF
jgi:iron complex outermembrane receptor protein